MAVESGRDPPLQADEWMEKGPLTYSEVLQTGTALQYKFRDSRSYVLEGAVQRRVSWALDVDHKYHIKQETLEQIILLVNNHQRT